MQIFRRLCSSTVPLSHIQAAAHALICLTLLKLEWGTPICPSPSGGHLLPRLLPFCLHRLRTPSESQDPEGSHAHPTTAWPAGTPLTAAAPISPLLSLIFPCPGTLHDEGTPLKP
ncbi:hypothetical protein M422DRAFT_275934 [Sphaerobolus stellatus SS14]|uniref:Uncharacterized protein n=1 Tax=Sphaerobolus stellatus (strain SS14) TaxID=990650 RepID=A0A0C9UE83_SPHS4|nr:hypothetical protein M422DRAFT_275934 [Sphaerobolus stellatus SS14]